MNIIDNQPGWVNTSCGYNPEQIFTSNLPSNLSVGNCDKSPSLSEYNKKLYTQNVGEDVFTQSQINEPINSNIGISFQQQFVPVSAKNEKQGLTFTEHDPRVIEPVYQTTPTIELDPITESNIYDPRHSGYGTSYRAYNEKVTGQTRFMYNDIDSVRMPNYITRSKIDVFDFADKYGPIQEECGNSNTSTIREKANQSWVENSLQFRTGLQQNLMRKRNNELAQVRMAPKGQQSYSSGAMGCR